MSLSWLTGMLALSVPPLTPPSPARRAWSSPPACRSGSPRSRPPPRYARGRDDPLVPPALFTAAPRGGPLWLLAALLAPRADPSSGAPLRSDIAIPVLTTGVERGSALRAARVGVANVEAAFAAEAGALPRHKERPTDEARQVEGDACK